MAPHTVHRNYLRNIGYIQVLSVLMHQHELLSMVYKFSKNVQDDEKDPSLLFFKVERVANIRRYSYSYLSLVSVGGEWMSCEFFVFLRVTFFAFRFIFQRPLATLLVPSSCSVVLSPHHCDLIDYSSHCFALYDTNTDNETPYYNFNDEDVTLDYVDGYC